MSTLAKRILKRMDELDMSQADLARKTGMTTANIAYIVNSKTQDPRISTVIAIARALGVTLDDLVM